MRNIVLGAIITVAGMGIAGIPSSAAPIGATQPMQTSIVEQAQSWATCRRLRRACENKDIRGEQGEGNCRRYRRLCGRR